MPHRTPAPTYANVLATLALIAALIAVVVALGDSHESVATQIVKQPVTVPVKSAEPPKTAPTTLPAGMSESGEYDERTGTSTEKGYVDEAVTFPIPLPGPLQVSHIIYDTQGGTLPSAPAPATPTRAICASTAPTAAAAASRGPKSTTSGSGAIRQEPAATGSTWSGTAPKRTPSTPAPGRSPPNSRAAAARDRRARR